MIKGVRILIAEDHTIVRSSLALLFSSHGALVIGEADTGDAAVTKALELRPDLVLMDITIPGIDGIEATRQICQTWPEARVLALTMHSEEGFLVPFLEAGGCGYVRKSAADRVLLDAIVAVLKGETFIEEGGIKALLKEHRRPAQSEVAPGPEVLSERERVVLELIARGYTSRQIGEQLGISPHTVDTYRSRILDKLDLVHRYELVEFALKHKILE
jgi:DNA-binding NarL/FixJ family response regulator